MPFPYPEKPEDWQAAYTKDEAHADSSKYGGRYMLPLILCFVVVYAYAFYLLHGVLLNTVFPLIAPLSLRYKLAFAFLGVAVPFLLFALAVMKPAIRMAASFFTKFYHPPEALNLAPVIEYRLNGKAKMPPPLDMFTQFASLSAQDGQLEKKDEWPAWTACNLGGPLKLVVNDGCALYLERGNRFSRVVGPGTPFLEWYETIKYVVDLRPKIKDGTIDAWTKDGISIKLTAQMECRIGDPSKNDPENGLVYPYDPVAAKKAIERYAVRYPDREKDPLESTWHDVAWGQGQGIISGYIGSRMLDDLFIAERDSGQILSPEAMKEVFEKINKATGGFGVYVTNFQIQKVEMPEEVYKHQQDNWRAERQSISTIVDGQAKAFEIRSREKARADAQRDLILAIADGLGKSQSENLSEPLLLSLSGVLDQSLKDPLMRAYLAKETIDALNQLKEMLDSNY